MTEVDDRTRPLLLAQAAKRGAEDWRHEDAEAVIAHLLAENDRLAASPEVAKLVAEAEARGWNNGMRIATSHVADVRNTQKPGAVFAALNEAMGRIEGARFAAIRRASEEAGT